MITLLLFLLGIFIGMIGTLIGIGGGFILIPLFLFLYPHEPVYVITTLSLYIVFFNSLVGTITYLFFKKIQYQLGFLFTICAIPGVLLGTLSINYLDKKTFTKLFGVFLLFISSYFIRKSYQTKQATRSKTFQPPSQTALIIGSFISFLGSYIASLFGLGGGFFQVPNLLLVAKLPPTQATATSQFILVFTSFLAIAFQSVMQKIPADLFTRSFYIAFGVILGSPLGVKLSSYLRTHWLLRVLAIFLSFVGLRFLFYP